MACPNCGFVTTPGQEAVQGTCPNCERPYRDQPTPLNSEMEMRNMPSPGGEDTGGNPLQEGILGDYQNRGVRDESFGSMLSATEPEFEVTEVIVPDPESIRADKEQMEKQADFLDTLGDIGQVAAPIAGGVGGFMLGGPAGAAIGAGLAGGGMSALNGGNVGEDIGTGVTDAALGGLGGMGAGAVGLGTVGADEAAAQGATKGGIGSLMKSAWGKIPTKGIQNAYMMHSLMNDASGQLQQATQPAQNMLPQQGTPPASIYSAVETPTSHGEIPSNNIDDPEEVDFHENEEDKPSLKDPSINDIGGTDLGPDNFFSPDSGGLAAFAELLPKILQFAISDQSAAGDPDMEDLHQKLEAEAPGYMNQANDDDGHKLIVMLMGGGGDAMAPDEDDDGLQDNDKPHDPISEHEATALRPGLETTCPKCGSVMDASNSHCPQCGLSNGGHDPQPTNPDISNPQEMQALAAANQGPNTDQQKAQVAELLEAEGRNEEIPTMIMEPWNYADELAKITQQEEPPEGVGQEGPPPPVPPSQPGEMPMPGMSSPEEGGMGQQMMAAINKYAATVDGFCEHCPKCDSHSTGYLDYEEGKAGCKSCGHEWTAPKMVKSVESAAEDMQAAPIEPELSQAQPDVEQEQNGSLSWTDESGTPLKVGQTYDMYSSNYDIPDRITVTAVKPDVIEYTINGEYGLTHQSELTHEEASIEGDRFVPTENEATMEPALEEAQGAQPMDPPPGQVTDLSTPHEMMTARTADFNDIDPPGVDSAGGNYEEPPAPAGSMNDVTFKDAKQAGRIMQALMKEGFPQQMAEQEAIRLTRGLGKFELENVAGDIQAAPEIEHPMGPTASVQPRKIQRSSQDYSVYTRMGSAPPMDSHDIALAEHSSGVTMFDQQMDTGPAPEPPSGETGPSWLMEGIRTSGAHMSPWEQRGYIDEIGDARNADKLQLSGTHYEMDDLLNDSFLFGL